MRRFLLVSMALASAAAATASVTATAVPGVAAAAVGTPGTPAAAQAARTTAHTATRSDAHPGLGGIPSGAPPAAYRRLPSLPRPPHRAWPFPASAFPHTSGTGRLAGGAEFWSDFVDDAFGAVALPGGPSTGNSVSTLAPTAGAYTYRNPRARGDGADIFTSDIGLTRRATYWRVDWNTLVDPRVPVAEWAFDVDDNSRTGQTAWPAGAGVNSPGIDKALVVSSRGARLLDVRHDRLVARLHTFVDRRTRSFIVRVPRRVLPVSRTWRVRLAAGLANAAGTGFAPANGAGPGQPNVYNVSFRSVRQEPPVYVPSGDDGDASGVGLARAAKYGNYWMETHQADALAHGDVSAFSLPVVWRQLAHRARTAEPLPRGYSVRWYVTPLHLGQGIVANPSTSGPGDLEPNYLSRIQPYSVYVPSDFSPHRRFALTWILHSLSVNYNQYGALDPAQIQQECEDRDSICATTEGFGPDGWYYDDAELDFWNVWHALATTYPLAPNRTVVSGYSMGGWASYKLGLTYPDLFAKAMPLAGPPGCGLRIAEGAGGAASSVPSRTQVRCAKDGDSTPMVGNARWVPYILGDGVADELVPISSVMQQIQAFMNRGLRIHAEIYPAEDHLVYATQDGFSSEIAQLGRTRRVVNPGRVDYTWYPDLTNRRLGIGPTGAYWIRGLSARDRKPGALAAIHANDRMRPQPVNAVADKRSVAVPGDPSPAVVLDQIWRPKHRPAPRRLLTVRTSNVAGFGIDLARARLRHGRLTVAGDGRLRVVLRHAAPGSVVRRGNRILGRARHGRIVVRLPKGTTRLRIT